MTETVRDYDVVVAGEDPPEPPPPALLAQAGWKVLVLEKERFPRYSVGESLMPYCYFTLERLGLIEQLKRSAFPRKYSVQFVSTSGRVSQPFYFFQHLDHEASTTWQVVRSEFDSLLLDNARAKGAAVREEVSVTRLVREAGSVTGVEAVTRDGERFRVLAPLTVDATGRAAVSAASNRWRIRDRAPEPGGALDLLSWRAPGPGPGRRSHHHRLPAREGVVLVYPAPGRPGQRRRRGPQELPVPRLPGPPDRVRPRDPMQSVDPQARGAGTPGRSGEVDGGLP